MEDLRDTHRRDVLRQRYAAAGPGWAHGVATGQAGAAPALVLAPLGPAALRRVENAAFGLRWVEIARGTRFDPSRSLVHQLGGNGGRDAREE